MARKYKLNNIKKNNNLINPESRTFYRIRGPNFLNFIFLKARKKKRKTSILNNIKTQPNTILIL